MAGKFEYQKKYDVNVCKQETSLLIGVYARINLLNSNRCNIVGLDIKDKVFDTTGLKLQLVRTIRSRVSIGSQKTRLGMARHGKARHVTIDSAGKGP